MLICRQGRCPGAHLGFSGCATGFIPDGGLLAFFPVLTSPSSTFCLRSWSGVKADSAACRPGVPTSISGPSAALWGGRRVRWGEGQISPTRQSKRSLPFGATSKALQGARPGPWSHVPPCLTFSIRKICWATWGMTFLKNHSSRSYVVKFFGSIPPSDVRDTESDDNTSSHFERHNVMLSVTPRREPRDTSWNPVSEVNQHEQVQPRRMINTNDGRKITESTRSCRVLPSVWSSPPCRSAPSTWRSSCGPYP